MGRANAADRKPPSPTLPLLRKRLRGVLLLTAALFFPHYPVDGSEEAMRYVVLFAFLLSLVPAMAETADADSTVDIFILRSAEQLQAPHIVSYRLFEWTQLHGRWLIPDLGYYDTGYGKDQTWFAAAGAYVVKRRRVDYYQELYFTQEAGSQSTNKRGLFIWPVLDARFRPHLTGELAIYPTVPLDRAQRWGLNMDRGKLEWAANSRWLIGAGYSGGICSARTWQNEPFLTATRKTRAGSFEFWLQRDPAGAQAQVRYTLVRHRE